MSALRRLRSLGLSGLLCSSILHAQLADITASRSGDLIRLSIHKRSSLSLVLQTVCAEVSARCRGTEKAATILLPAQDLSGTWRQITSSLLEGTNLNYVASTASSPVLSLEILENRMAISKSPGQGTEATTVIRNGHRVQIPDNASLKSTYAEPVTEPQLERAGDIEAPADRPAVSDSTVGTAGSGSVGLPTASSTSLSPFPDSHGHPIPAAQVTSNFLPFPDSRGYPIPISNQPELFLLFPDSQGKPIPVSSEPAQFLLFPDSRGNPIPVQTPR